MYTRLMNTNETAKSMTKTKVSLKCKVVTLAMLPILLPLTLPAVLKTVFYSISLFTESVGVRFEEADAHIGRKTQKFFKWVKSI